ncbi:hypothetical protein PTKIN_Ptkin14bG0067500 [Pterospermum kingtungense]
MADEFNTATNWWDSSRSTNNRFDATAAGSSAPSSGLNNSLGSFGWATEMVDIKSAAARSSMDSVSSVSGGPDHHHHHQHQHQPPGDNLHMMGLGLSSQAVDWNQALMHGDKSHESSFRSMLQDQQETGTGGVGFSQVHWRSDNEFKQISSRGFSLDQSSSSSQFSPHGTSSDSTVTICQGLPSSFQMDSSTAILQGLLGSENQTQHQSSYYGAASSYGSMNITGELLPNSWSKVPQFLRSSPPKHLHGQLHFSNNAPFWNPSAAAAASMVADVRPASGFFPPLQTQFPTANFDEKPKNISQVRDSTTVVKKSGNEPTSNKRPRNETSSTLPAFKVRKEKMGDRITALQQLVSPFGKTDTASVLSEAIEYIKFLHEQVSVLSTPYMKSGAALQVQQNSEKSKDPEGPKQDLRSRGLCLVPVSSTFPVTHESPVDFWTPTFGGTYR